MRKILFKLLFFCLLPMPFIYLLSIVVDKGMHNSQKPPFVEWNAINNGTVNTGMLILGSSRSGHFATDIIDKELHVKSYCIGAVSFAFDMQDCFFKYYLKYNKKPTYILQSMDIFMLHEPEALHSPHQFLPYINEDLIKKTCDKYSDCFPSYYYTFPLIKYRGNVELIYEGISMYNQKFKKSLNFSGYKGIDMPWDGSFDRWKLRHPNGFSQSISLKTCLLFESYLSFCKKNNIKVILVYSPEYKPLQNCMRNRSEIVARYKTYSKIYNMPFLDYANDSLCNNKSYFVNGSHLNKKGTEIFTKILVKDLKKILF
jgi:hypothetical protein